MQSVASLLCQDKCWGFLVESGDDNEAIFARAQGWAICALQARSGRRASRRTSPFAAHSSPWLSALGKGVVATVLMLQRLVRTARPSYVALQKHAATSFGADFLELAADV